MWLLSRPFLQWYEKGDEYIPTFAVSGVPLVVSLTGLSQGSAYSDLVLYRLPLSIFYLKQSCAA